MIRTICVGLLLGLGLHVEGVRAGEDTFPPLPAKQYQIGIAPAHITTPPGPLFQSTSQWGTVAAHIGLYKYYGVQLNGTTWAKPFDPRALADFAKKQHIEIGCEFGSFGLGEESIPDAAEAAFREIDPIFQAGGSVASLHLDDPIQRMIKGNQKNPNALALPEVVDRLVAFWQKVHAKYPALRIGLITNFPNWDYTRELVGRNGQYTDRSGLTYAEVLAALHRALTKAGERIEFVEVDNPYNYYREKRTRNNDAALNNRKNIAELQQWCSERDIRFHIILNAEPGQQGAPGFHDGTCEYVRQLRRDGIFPDVFIIQSWYKQPDQNLPETKAGTFMNTARDAINLVRELYPSSETKKAPAPR